MAAVLAAGAPVVDDPMLALGLFLLGYGWNLCFVGGSSLLSRDLPLAEQAQTQGAVDAVVWSTSALASLLSGALLATGGYVLVAAVGGVAALLPVVLIVLARVSKRDTPTERVCDHVGDDAGVARPASTDPLDVDAGPSRRAGGAVRGVAADP